MKGSAEYHGMKCRLAGRSGLWLSEIGLGLWKWGDPSYDESRVGDHDGFAILDRAQELGVFHWDTACSYNKGAGNSERLLGRYFASRGSRVRDRIVLATKVSNSVRPEHEMKTAFTPNQRGASRLYLRREVEACLQRLQTDRIDLLYLHSPNVDDDGQFLTPPDETWGAMDDLVSQGKVNYLGVSNHTATQIDTVRQTLANVGKDTSRRILVVQNRYNLLERARVAEEKNGSEAAFLSFCEQNGIGIVPYFPLASGTLTGRYRRDNLANVQGRIISDGTQAMFLTDRNLRVIDALDPLAREKGISLSQLAIAWLLSRPPVVSVIAGVTRMEHLEDNAKSPQVKLSDEDLQRIDQVLQGADAQ
jgi:aryl-alcohol dehydrogenase-like predicted oxidoreductase